jgi:hypothetical protein
MDFDGLAGGAEGVVMDALQRSVVNRLKTACGQVGGIISAVEADEYCPDVMKQLSAVQRLLEGSSRIWQPMPRTRPSTAEPRPGGRRHGDPPRHLECGVSGGSRWPRQCRRLHAYPRKAMISTLTRTISPHHVEHRVEHGAAVIGPRRAWTSR